VEKTLDPAYAKALAKVKEAGVEPADPLKMSVEAAREAQDRYFAFLAQDPPEVASVRDYELHGPAGAFRIRVYHPAPGRITPVIVFVRGGGWWAGTLDSHDRTMRLLAKESGFAVCGVDYHRAPEQHFPTQLNEVVEAVRWLWKQGVHMGIDAKRVVLSGESAGANLCTLAAVKLTGGAHPLRGLALFYGNYALPKPSSREYSKRVWTQYLGCELERADPAAVPLEHDVSGLPPTWLGIGEADPLLDDTLRFAEKLAAAGVQHEVKRYPGLPHAFVMLTRLYEGAADAVRDVARAAQRFAA
jgi:acetyl esterase